MTCVEWSATARTEYQVGLSDCHDETQIRGKPETGVFRKNTIEFGRVLRMELQGKEASIHGCTSVGAQNSRPVIFVAKTCSIAIAIRLND